MADNEDDWTDYESGPFCRHYGDPNDCDEVCATCGHRCTQHRFGDWDTTECTEDGCECEEWKDSDGD